MWITRHGRNPQTTFIVERHLNGVGKRLKLFLRGEKFNLIALCNRNRLLSFFPVQVFQCTVLSARLVVSGNLRELRSFGIRFFKIKLLASNRCPDGVITIDSHFSCLLELKWVVLRAKWVVASSIHVNSIWYFEVIEPHPVLVLYVSKCSGP